MSHMNGMGGDGGMPKQGMMPTMGGAGGNNNNGYPMGHNGLGYPNNPFPGVPMGPGPNNQTFQQQEHMMQEGLVVRPRPSSSKST